MAPKVECQLHGGVLWRELRSRHFVLTTDADSDAARAALERLETLRSIMLQAWPDTLDPPGHMDVILLARGQEFREFDLIYVGEMVSTLPYPTMVLPTEFLWMRDRGPPVTTVAHELSHYLMAYDLARRPRWFNEGMAQALETIELNDQGSVARIRSRVNEDYQKPILALDDLWGWDSKSPKDADIRQYYTSSRAWVQAMRALHPDHFISFWEALKRGESARTAWLEAFAGLADDELRLQVRDYVTQADHPVVTLAFQTPNVETTERALDPAEVHLMRAYLIKNEMASQNSTTRQRRIAHEIDLALAIDRNNAAAEAMHISMGRDRTTRFDAARALVKEQPHSIDAWRLLTAAAEEVGSPTPGTAGLEQITDEAHDDALLLAALVRIYAQNGSFDRALPVSARAAELAPYAPGILAWRAFILARTGDCGLAIDMQRRAMAALGENTPNETLECWAKQLAEYEQTCQTSEPSSSPQ